MNILPANQSKPGSDFRASPRHPFVRVILAFILVSLLLPGCSVFYNCSELQSSGECLRILFIGNSFTSTNDLPRMFSDLAGSGGHRVETGMTAEGGLSLTDHASSITDHDLITGSKWDYVVLQEQSDVPSTDQSRLGQMYPAARALNNAIQYDGAKTIFFMTWAHRDGSPANGFPDYQSMQFQVDSGYMTIAQELNAELAPVGYAWLLALGQNPDLSLWQDDGSHPSRQGTYLAACVFYAVIFRKSPEGLSHPSDLSADTAHFLQKVAGDTVLNSPQTWNLP